MQPDNSFPTSVSNEVSPRRLLASLTIDPDIRKKIAKATGYESISDGGVHDSFRAAARGVLAYYGVDIFKEFFSTELARRNWWEMQTFRRSQSVEKFPIPGWGRSMTDFANRYFPILQHPELVGLLCAEAVSQRVINVYELKEEHRFRASLAANARGHMKKGKLPKHHVSLLENLELDCRILKLVLFKQNVICKRVRLSTVSLSGDEISILRQLWSSSRVPQKEAMQVKNYDWKEIAREFNNKTGRRLSPQKLAVFCRHNFYTDEEHAARREMRAARIAIARAQKQKLADLASKYSEAFPSLRRNPTTGAWEFGKLTPAERPRISQLLRGAIPWSSPEEEWLSDFYSNPDNWSRKKLGGVLRMDLLKCREQFNDKFKISRTVAQLNSKLTHMGKRTTLWPEDNQDPED